MNAEILHQDIQTLLEYFSKNSYRASDSKSSDSFFVSILINPAKYFLTSFIEGTLRHSREERIYKRQLQALRIFKIFASRIYAFKKNKEKSDERLLQTHETLREKKNREYIL